MPDTLFSFLTFTYLFELQRRKYKATEREGETQRERDLPSLQPGNDQAQSQELRVPSGLPCGWQQSMDYGHLPLPFLGH